MQKVLLIFLCQILFTTALFSQTTQRIFNNVNAEKLSEKPGSFVQKQFIEIGKQNEISLYAIRYLELLNNQKADVLQVSYKTKTASSNLTVTSLLDFDEIDLLIKVMEVIANKGKTETPKIYTEHEFKSRSGFCVGSYFSDYDKKWDFYIKAESTEYNSLTLTLAEFENLLNLIKTVKAKV